MGIAELLALSFLAGLGVAALTTPVGVSGAVFLLPVQLTVLQVPNPAVTPTNLLFNILAIPGALLRYRTQAPLRNALTSVLLIGTIPGVVVGAIVRVFVLPGPHVFRLLLAGFLLPLSIWLLLPPRRKAPRPVPALPSRRVTVVLASGVGVLGGIYGIGGGSLLSPMLVSRGLPVALVAPAALLTTFVTSIAGAVTYVVLAVVAAGAIAPYWTVGLAAGAGGLFGGYLGARLQTHIHDRHLRIALGLIALATAIAYVAQAVH